MAAVPPFPSFTAFAAFAATFAAHRRRLLSAARDMEVCESHRDMRPRPSAPTLLHRLPPSVPRPPPSAAHLHPVCVSHVELLRRTSVLCQGGPAPTPHTLLSATRCSRPASNLPPRRAPPPAPPRSPPLESPAAVCCPLPGGRASAVRCTASAAPHPLHRARERCPSRASEGLNGARAGLHRTGGAAGLGDAHGARGGSGGRSRPRPPPFSCEGGMVHAIE